MATMKFKVGDKVIANEKASEKFRHTKAGWRGTVEKIIVTADDCETILDAVFGGPDHVTFRVRGEVCGCNCPMYFTEDDMVKYFDLAEPDKSETCHTADPFLQFKRILRSGDRFHVFWADGTKTTVRRSPGEPDSNYAAFTAALGIKLYGSNSRLKRIIDKHLEVQSSRLDKTDGEISFSDDQTSALADTLGSANPG